MRPCSSLSCSRPIWWTSSGDQVGRGRGLERPAIIFVAMRARPHARRRRWRPRAAACSSAIWRCERGSDLALWRSCGRGRPNRRRYSSPWCGVRSSSTSAAALRASFSAIASWSSALSIRKVGRDQPLRARRAHPLELAVELRRILREAARDRPRRRPRFSIGWSVSRNCGVSMIGADILDHDIGRVAPAADGDVAVGQREAFERGR